MKARKRGAADGRAKEPDVAESLRRAKGLLDIGREQLSKAHADLGIASAGLDDVLAELKRRAAALH